MSSVSSLFNQPHKILHRAKGHTMHYSFQTLNIQLKDTEKEEDNKWEEEKDEMGNGLEDESE
jgi:hypothetical protein